MSEINVLLKRNVIRFFRNKAAVFFTFLAPIIFVMVFLLFARRQFVSSVEHIPGFTPERAASYADLLLLSSICAVSTFTNALSLSGSLVYDKQNKVLTDFGITPTNSAFVRFSYVIFNYLMNVILTALVYVIVVVYMAIVGTIVGNPIYYVYCFLFIFFAALVNTLIVSFALSFISNVNVFSAITAVLSSVIGFLIGAYIPWGAMPEGLKFAASVLPQTQIVNIFQNIMISNISEIKFAYQPQHVVLINKQIDIWVAYVYIAAWLALMLTINLTVNFKIKKQ
ncbi:ABC transporter [Mycoplasmopsis californica]|uniref:ABC transporter permease n=1 Tax=Mycoplasmopsis equigenitalium TaxID=114883 RepID=A0ABY5J1W5_9BACT|nr:ABC transporter permease [Mycoplasmopsis equigenitalium]UUD37244.1 ABC transporter permease [Mycoplasmopsis equigenitalium]VEU69448.1 ABC transporter [Mycoplasmopsis californica]